MYIYISFIYIYIYERKYLEIWRLPFKRTNSEIVLQWVVLYADATILISQYLFDG